MKYKSVNTYSGWTSATRHKYQTVKVKMVKSTAKETLIERLKPPPESDEKNEEKDKEVNKQCFLICYVCNFYFSFFSVQRVMLSLFILKCFLLPTDLASDQAKSKSMPILNDKAPMSTNMSTKKLAPDKQSKHKTPVNIRKKSINEE